MTRREKNTHAIPGLTSAREKRFSTVDVFRAHADFGG
jgi:hypothetical protein